MRKFMVLLAGALTIGMMTACAPTKVSNSDRPDFGGFAPETGAPVAMDRTPVPGLPSKDMVFVFRGNSDGTKLERVQSFTDELTEDYLIEKLIEYGVLEEGTEILSLDIVGELGAGPGMPADTPAKTEDRVGTVNLSKVPSLGAEEEKIMLNSIAATFIENYQLDEVKLLVNGENYSSENITQGDDDYLEFDMDYVNVEDENNDEDDWE